jgi:hypothetical protein
MYCALYRVLGLEIQDSRYGLQGMAETIRKHQKELVRMVEQFTTDHEIRAAKSGHISITIRRNGAHRTVFSPLTPSDHRSMLNVKTKVRRAYNEMIAA